MIKINDSLVDYRNTIAKENLRYRKTSDHEIMKAIHPHPTMSEAINEAAAAAYDEVIHI